MPPSPKQAPKPNSFFLIGVFLMFALIGVVALIAWVFLAPTAIDYSDFHKLVAAGKVKSVTIIGESRIKGEIKESEMGSAEVQAAGLKKREFETELLQK